MFSGCLRLRLARYGWLCPIRAQGSRLPIGAANDRRVERPWVTCDNFLYPRPFKGAPAARQSGRRAGAGSAAASAESSGRMRDWQTECRHARSGERWANRGAVGRRPAAPLRAEALRTRRRTPVSWPAPRRPVAQALTIPGDRTCVSDRAVLLAPGILSPRKDHRQGRTSSLRCGRSTLTVIFPGKTSAPIGRTDHPRLVLHGGRQTHARPDAATSA
jgi:hypothetical protein